ncbi:ABC transporter permease subunit, partial [Pelagibacteraceae bacterium]|nr:ABC transporter permease subunit [Pelagibacteraceae bacterium]
FLMYNSFNSIPKSLREVAILNDSSEIKILFSIMIPLAIPGLITLIIFAIYVSWTDYLLAFIIMNSADMQMLNVTLSKIGFRSIYPYAGYVISYLPFMIIFIFLQKFYFKSIISSS